MDCLCKEDKEEINFTVRAAKLCGVLLLLLSSSSNQCTTVSVNKHVSMYLVNQNMRLSFLRSQDGVRFKALIRKVVIQAQPHKMTELNC